MGYLYYFDCVIILFVFKKGWKFLKLGMGSLFFGLFMVDICCSKGRFLDVYIMVEGDINFLLWFGFMIYRREISSVIWEVVIFKFLMDMI